MQNKKKNKAKQMNSWFNMIDDNSMDKFDSVLKHNDKLRREKVKALPFII